MCSTPAAAPTSFIRGRRGDVARPFQLRVDPGPDPPPRPAGRACCDGRPWRADANGWVAVLKAAARGSRDQSGNDDDAAERLAELGRPCLPHLDYLVVNDFEIGALAGVATRRADGSTDVAAVRRAIAKALEIGAMRWVVAHFPEGAVAGGRDGTTAASARSRRRRT